ncbi:MAG: hypothetical protein H8M99_14715 [Gloeobacteraceae cyanobacterium ES-bin-144]|nr:hypothetical protein [Verrucomicrobiales bacterium]
MNRAQACLRVMLWLLPSGFAVGSFLAGSHFLRNGLTPWIFANIIFIIGMGWLHAYMFNRARSENDGVLFLVLVFFIVQLFFVPLVLFTILCTICGINWNKF